MRKEEFLEKLRARLSQTMSQQEVTAQIRYYENYIQEQMQNGRSEEEVLTELGDPLLIAKTLMDVQETQEEYSRPETNVYEERGGQESGDAQRELHRMEIKTREDDLLVAVIFVVGRDNDPVGSRDSAHSSAPDIDPVNGSFVGCGIF
mgnify:CR=1 FL=1